MIHFGLDLSITKTGLARLEPGSYPIAHVVVSKPAGHPAGTIGRRERFRELTEDVRDFVFGDAAPPRAETRIWVEAPLYDSRTSGSQFDRAGSWWEIVGGFIDYGYAVIEINNAWPKQFAVGNGKADKLEMMAALLQQMPGVAFKNDNDCDAIWLAALGEYRMDPDFGRVARTKYRDGIASKVPLS